MTLKAVPWREHKDLPKIATDAWAWCRDVIHSGMSRTYLLVQVVSDPELAVHVAYIRALPVIEMVRSLAKVSNTVT
jgi:hypothetical protein